MIAKRIVVEGWVQDVGYRDYVLRVAVLAGICGTVRNRSDGSVEIIAEGVEDTVLPFIEGLKSDVNQELGGCMAKVTRISEEEVPFTGFTEFRVKR